MFVAHLPAGYLFTSALRRRLDAPLAVGLVGSIAPDLDLFWFYFVDGRQTLHHHYWTHLPTAWLVAGLVAFTIARCFGQIRIADAVVVFAANGLLHLVLDSVVGRIEWLAPFGRDAFALFEVPAIHGHWILNFVRHWSFAIELAIVVGAITLAAAARTPARARPAPAAPAR